MACASPLGEAFTVKPSPGFPERLDPGVDGYHGYDVPDGPYPDSVQTLEQHIARFPTPGPQRLVRPATPEGTLNEATPEWLRDYFMGDAAAAGAILPPDGPVTPVRSYLRTDQNGRQVVVNVSEQGSLLHPGYVARYVTPSAEGSTIHNEGEGSSWLQYPYSPFAAWLRSNWRGLYRKQTDKR